MALKSKDTTSNIVFKKRGDNNKKKVLIYGEDGSGKSTFAETYCNKHGLNPVVLDIEDTNYTDLPMASDFDLSSDRKSYRMMKNTLEEINELDFDTIIIDGVDSLVESFISDAGGIAKYGDRSRTSLKFINDCLRTGKNLIFIGQAPVDLDYYRGTDKQPNSIIIKLNAMVNEKYCCTLENDKYKVRTVKYRVKEKEGE